MVILVDFGSTNNFLNPSVAKKAKLCIKTIPNWAIKIANGDIVRSKGCCCDLTNKIPGNQFVS